MRLKPSVSFCSRLARCSKASWLAGSILSCLLSGTVHSAQTKTNRAPAQVAIPQSEVTIPQSVFATEGTTGKDPFFPNSIRRMKRDDSGKQSPTRDFSGLLKLTGIAGGVKPIATINNLTFAAGEEQEVKVEGGKLKIRVVEIRVKSVVISVEKQPQPIELKLRDVNLKFDE
jgi:hypothetical protein